MEKTNQESSIDINTYFSESFNTDENKYLPEFDTTIKNLLASEISGYSNLQIILVGRKSKSLFQPYIKQISETNALRQIEIIQIYSHTAHPLVRIVSPLCNHGKNKTEINQNKEVDDNTMETIILVDAINHGNEIRTVLEHYEDTKILKICGYLANKKTLSGLRKNHTDIQFSFVKIAEELDNYNAEQDRLQLIYQNRLIPIDSDHPYKIYALKFQIGAEDIKAYIISVLHPLVTDENEIQENQLLAKNIFSYTAELDYTNICAKFPELQSDKYNVDVIKIRFKIDETTSKMCITAMALVNIDSDIAYNNCSIPIIDKCCRHIIVPEEPKDKPQEKICPNCIDRTISLRLLQHIDSEIKKMLSKANITIDELAHYENM